MRPSTADVRVRDERDEEPAVGCSLAEFKLLGELGKGAYGTVYRVLSLRDGKEYVLKKIPIKHLKKNEIQDVVKEAKILRKVDNQFIIKSFSHFVEGGALNIVMEFAEGGDLQKVAPLLQSISRTIRRLEVLSPRVKSGVSLRSYHKP
jgi:NIMA (never in mitosis gene a)-related kinase